MDDIIKVGGVGDRTSIIGLNAYWRDQQFEYTDSLLTYRGVHYDHNKGDADENWEIWKYTYSSALLVRIEGPLSGAWDDRATLDWA